MIEVVLLRWHDNIHSMGREAISSRLRRLSQVGVDVVLFTAGEAGVESPLPAAHEGPGRLYVWSDVPTAVVELRPDGTVPVWTGEGQTRSGELVAADDAPGRGALAWARWWLLGPGGPDALLVVGPGADGDDGGAPSPPPSTEPATEVVARLDEVLAAQPPLRGSADPLWGLEVDGFDPGREHDVESWLTVANGRSGTRGSLEEGSDRSSPAVFVAGVYVPSQEKHLGPELVRGPEWTRLRPRADDADVDLGTGDTVEHRRELDLRHGTVRRRWRQRLPSGRYWTFRSARWASLADRHLLALEAEADCAGTTISLDGPVPLPVGQPAVTSAESCDAEGSCDVSLEVPGGRTVEFAVRTHEARGRLRRIVSLDRVGLDDGLTHLDPLEEVGMAELGRMWARHRAEWRRRWRDADVVAAGDAGAQRALRFALYHLISSGDPESNAASIGARGLTGPGYRGHVFWDTEVFVLPFFVWTHPPTARALLSYRYRTLPAARAKATRLGFSGALYAWESADTGEETTPEYVELPDGTRLKIVTGQQEHHISADVAWACWQYWRVTGDDRFLADMGAEMIVETARFWESRARPGVDGRRHIDGVVGPDEYHEGVDDNAFTNVMAAWNLRTAIEVRHHLSTLDGAAATALDARLGLDDAEAARWGEVADTLVDQFHPDSLLYEQFAGFFDLEDVQAVHLAPRPFTGELVLGVDRLRDSQVVKQADVLMLGHMLPDLIAPEVVAANYRYYEPRTCHGSSLSPAIHATVAARVGNLPDAQRYFDMAAGVDLDDRMGNAALGVHVATMGGLWQAAVFGFGGVRADGDAVRLDPRVPPSWDGLGFPLRWRGSRLDVQVTGDVVRLRLDHPARVALGLGAPVPVAAGDWSSRREGGEWSPLRPTAGG